MVGFTTFPDEIFRAPRSWVEQAYPNPTYFNEVHKGHHFAARTTRFLHLHVSTG